MKIPAIQWGERKKGNLMHIAYPLRITQEGLAATAHTKQHVEQLIEQLLFTTPGERVNRPDFGTAISQLIFSPGGNEELVAATQFLVQGALQQWLGDVIQIQGVRVVSLENTLTVTITYAIKRTQELQIAQFVR
jgi:Bacteriophage baseplate protein W